jgi:ABC-type nickel/cobalt efflux system permease component RcnA
MSYGPELLLIGAVAAVGVLHTMVPDHWVPITLIARQQGWSRRQTVNAALKAGTGHVLSTLLIAAVVWIAGVAFAQRFGHYVDTASSLALIGFGGWIAISSLMEMRGAGGHGHSHGQAEHHQHHDHDHGHTHSEDGHHHDDGARPAGKPKISSSTALLLILGSSPMVEGIPAFFAAAKYGVGLILLMSAVFAMTTIATYVVLCVYSAAGLQRVTLGPLEKYGEVLSGAFIVLVGIAFWVWPVL